MKFRLTDGAQKDYSALFPAFQTRVDKQLRLLLNNLQHPSLHAKKYNEKYGVWQGRITRDWRFYFLIQNDTYVILAITPHPK